MPVSIDRGRPRAAAWGRIAARLTSRAPGRSSTPNVQLPSLAARVAGGGWRVPWRWRFGGGGWRLAVPWGLAVGGWELRAKTGGRRQRRSSERDGVEHALFHVVSLLL